MIDNTLIWAVIVAFLAIVFVRKSVIIVRQGYEYTVERFGKYSTTFSPGFHIMIPFHQCILLFLQLFICLLQFFLLCLEPPL